MAIIAAIACFVFCTIAISIALMAFYDTRKFDKKKRQQKKNPAYK
jgi:preprotein translocase subunit SecG